MSELIDKKDSSVIELESSTTGLALAKPEKVKNIELEHAGRKMKIGIGYRRKGRFHEAENAYQDALRIYSATSGTDFEQAECTKGLGIIYTLTERFHEAENAIEAALRIYRTIPGQELEQAFCIENLGNVYCENGRFYEAENAYWDAVDFQII